MKMFASELTPTGNFFVGGTFESRVWSGEKFVDVQNIAVYQPRKNAWLPLQKDTVRTKERRVEERFVVATWLAWMSLVRGTVSTEEGTGCATSVLDGVLDPCFVRARLVGADEFSEKGFGVLEVCVCTYVCVGVPPQKDSGQRKR